MKGEPSDKLEYKMKGKTWKVYWYMLTHGDAITVRELQRALHFSSPSVSKHHLERLCELKLAKRRRDGRYLLTEKRRVGVLRHFVKVGRLLLPRYALYALSVTISYLVYILLILLEVVNLSLYGLLLGATVIFIFWYEAVRFWKLKPF